MSAFEVRQEEEEEEEEAEEEDEKEAEEKWHERQNGYHIKYVEYTCSYARNIYIYIYIHTHTPMPNILRSRGTQIS